MIRWPHDHLILFIIMSFTVFFPIIIILFIVCYGACISYVKSLRNGNQKGLKFYQVILLCALFGGPALLITYMFKEIREEDYLHHHCYLLFGILLTMLQVSLVVLLCVFKVITF